MTVPPRIPLTEAQIDRVVSQFYARVRADPDVGPVFAGHVADWPTHEEKIGRFWRNALLYRRCYDGNPMQVHAAAGDVRARHFPVWLSLFDAVLEQELLGHCQVDGALDGGQPDWMLNLDDLSRLKGYRFPRTVIGYAVWAYHRFALSLRDVEDLLAERGVIVSYETIRAWVGKFGTQISARTRRDRPDPATKWPLDEVVLKINGVKHWLWRAIDTNGPSRDIATQCTAGQRTCWTFSCSRGAILRRPSGFCASS